MTLAEMRHGALAANWGQKKRDVLEEYLQEFGVLHSDSLLCSTWAAVRNESARKGRQIGHAERDRRRCPGSVVATRHE